MILAFLAPIAAKLVPYKLIIIGLAIAAAVVVVDRRATYRERAKCDTAALRAENAALQRDLNIQRDTANSVRVEMDKLQDREADLSKKVSDYEAHLSKRTDACRLSEPERRRLLNIR